jgi:hypothetical protein
MKVGISSGWTKAMGDLSRTTVSGGLKRIANIINEGKLKRIVNEHSPAITGARMIRRKKIGTKTLFFFV